MEILNGNREYKRFGEERIIVSTLNIGELYLINLREFGKDYAMKLISKLKFQTLEISNEIIINAMDFKHQYRKRKFS